MKSVYGARFLTLQVLYGLEFFSKPQFNKLKELFDLNLLHRNLSKEGYDFAYSLAFGAFRYKDFLDAVISQLACKRPVNELAILDRNILRIAVFEILFVEGISFGISANEAVELAKKFGHLRSHGFVNAVLRSFTSKKASNYRQDLKYWLCNPNRSNNPPKFYKTESLED